MKLAVGAISGTSMTFLALLKGYGLSDATTTFGLVTLAIALLVLDRALLAHRQKQPGRGRWSRALLIGTLIGAALAGVATATNPRPCNLLSFEQEPPVKAIESKPAVPTASRHGSSPGGHPPVGQRPPSISSRPPNTYAGQDEKVPHLRFVPGCLQKHDRPGAPTDGAQP